MPNRALPLYLQDILIDKSHRYSLIGLPLLFQAFPLFSNRALTSTRVPEVDLPVLCNDRIMIHVGAADEQFLCLWLGDTFNET